MPRVKLNHVSHAKGSEGNPGDVVDATDGLAAIWCADGAAEMIEAVNVKADIFEAVTATEEQPEPEPEPKQRKRKS